MNAVFTFAKDETVLLPIWLKYYSKLFDHVLVINHESDVTELHKQYDFEERPITNSAYHNQSWIVPLICEQQKALLEKYTIVVYAEADEFFIANPYKYKDLKEYLEHMNVDYVHAKGYEPVQIKNEDKAIDWTKPLLAQRRYWIRYKAYDKPNIGRVPIDWGEGFHCLKGKDLYERDIKPYMDEDLYLIHVPRIDWDLFKTRRMWRFKHDDGRFSEKMDMKEEIPEKFKLIL